MGRMGTWYARARNLLAKVREEPWLDLSGLYTHYAAADSDEAYTHLQSERFREILEAEDFLPPWVHAGNSAAFLRGQLSPRENAVRIGILQQGVLPGSHPGPSLNSEGVQSQFGTMAPLLSVSAPVWHAHPLDDGRMELQIGCGFAHGFPSRYAKTGEVLAGGCRGSICPPVTAHAMRVRLRPTAGWEPPERITLIGREGSEEITVAAFAERAQQRKWETLCSLIAQAQRIFSDA
jgi:alanine racemase